MKRSAAAAAILAVVSLFASSGALATHPQGCNPLIGGGIAPTCPPPPKDDMPPLKLSGCAYGAYANVTDVVTGNHVLPNTAPTNFTTMTGASAVPALSAPCPIFPPSFHAGNQLLGVNLPPSLPIGGSLGIMKTRVDAEAFSFPGTGYSLSSAETAQVSLSVPSASLTITADVVRAVAYCTAMAGPLGRNDTGPAGYGPATLAGLTIQHPSLSGGQLSINVLPPEDTWIPIPGLGGIMLRETWDLEMPPYPGSPYKSFTENMIHVYFFGNVLISGDIVVSHAHCDGYNLQGVYKPSGNPTH